MSHKGQLLIALKLPVNVAGDIICVLKFSYIETKVNIYKNAILGTL